VSEVYELEKGLERIKNRILEIKRNRSGPIIVGVAGGSGSGKTTKVAQKIENAMLDAKILSMDDYFRGKEFMASIHSDNWDEPRVYELDLLQQHLKILQRGESIQKPVYSFSEARRVGYQSFGPHGIIALEGLLALYSGIVEELDLKIFVDIAVHGSLMRRILRDVGRTGQTQEQILEQYVRTVYPMFKLHIEPTKAFADIVIVNQYVPEIEADCCETREIQIKVALPRVITEEILAALGFIKTSETLEEDTYYSAPNWPADYGGEMMRIREEGGKYFLAYKGPQEAGPFRIRPKIEFEVKPSLKDALKQLGYREILSFAKKRKKFLGRDLEVAIDEFTNGYCFLELRTADPKGELEIFKCLERLSIPMMLLMMQEEMHDGLLLY